MKKEIVLVLIVLIGFPVMGDERVELESLPQAIGESASAVKENTLHVRTSKKSSLPSGVSHIGSVRRVDPPNDYQKAKPQYQSITVLKSTIPEIPEGSVFKSKTHGTVFFFKGCWLVLSTETDHLLDEFGGPIEKDSYRWVLSNFIDVITPNEGIWAHGNRIMSYRTLSGTDVEVWKTDCTSERYPVNESMAYPLRLTNDLYVIEFAAPQELVPPQRENQPLARGKGVPSLQP